MHETEIVQKAITCGDTAIILGLEEQYRRTTNNLEDFIRHMPHFKEFEPAASINCTD